MTVTPVIHVSEIEPALAFYCDTLGFDRIWAFPEEGTAIITHAEIALEGASLIFTRSPEEASSGGQGSGVELYFRISADIDAYFERLRAARVDVKHEPVDQMWGDRTFSIRDPSGHWLTFARVALPKTKAELLERIDEAWDILGQTLGQLSEVQLTGPRDAGGWSVKDHIIHLAAWERSMIYLLQGRPRHEGLGVGQDLYLGENEDAINAAIWEQHKDRPLQDVRDEFQVTHRQMLGILDSLTYDDLLKPYSAYLPDEPGEDDGQPIMGRLLGNTSQHFMLHRGWIEKLAG